MSGRAGVSPPWLLIGNSRWHWAQRHTDGSLVFWDSQPPATLAAPLRPRSWAAVGAVPPDLPLPAAVRLTLAAVPLAAAPPWLGVDRALAAWGAWQRWRCPLLVVDAGTALSFTRVDSQGGFAGGRLQAGVALQWRALATGTAALAAPAATLASTAWSGLPPVWPAATDEALASGVLRGCAAAVAAAWRDGRQQEPRLQLVLTGGDGSRLVPLLAAEQALVPELRHAAPVRLSPHLVMEALVALRPDAADGP